MLVLSRNRDDEILIGDAVVKVLKIDGSRVQLGIEAPPLTPIVRMERATPAVVESMRDRLIRLREARAANVSVSASASAAAVEPAA